MAFDFKKEYPELYRPGQTPVVVDVPKMQFLAVRGTGDPNETDGAYAHAVQLLYTLAYTLRMSHKGERKIEGYFEYVVPPLEGFWWQEGLKGYDKTRKSDFSWVSLLRLPDFIGTDDFDWAVREVERKKNMDTSKAQFLTFTEGLCVQMLHLGPYHNEDETLAVLKDYIDGSDYDWDYSDTRHHHEIYLSDPRRSRPENLKTILRLPVKKRGQA